MTNNTNTAVLHHHASALVNETPHRSSRRSNQKYWIRATSPRFTKRQARVDSSLSRLATSSPHLAEVLAQSQGTTTLDQIRNAPVGSSAVFIEPTFEWPLVAMKVSPGLWAGTRGHWRDDELAQRPVSMLGGMDVA